MRSILHLLLFIASRAGTHTHVHIHTGTYTTHTHTHADFLDKRNIIKSGMLVYHNVLYTV